MMLARAFNSAKASRDTLKRTVMRLTSTIYAWHTLRDDSGRWTSPIEKTKELTEVILERWNDDRETAMLAQMMEDTLGANADMMRHVNDGVAECFFCGAVRRTDEGPRERETLLYNETIDAVSDLYYFGRA
jgi:hypothetical protein